MAKITLYLLLSMLIFFFPFLTAYEVLSGMTKDIIENFDEVHGCNPSTEDSLPAPEFWKNSVEKFCRPNQLE